MSQKLLTISILLSGREKTTFRCLESIRPLLSAIDAELVLIDTGCGEDLRERLKEYTSSIISFTWCNDFSKARNVGLQNANGKWFLYLDDDEWFTEVQNLIDFFKTGEYRNYTSASYIQRNYLDFEGTQYTDSWVNRMACITPELHFESKIHEYMTPLYGQHKNIVAIVDHYGYVYATEEDKMAHFKRNEVLLKDMIAQEPSRLRWRLQLLQEYRAIDNYVKMEELGKAGIEMIGQRGMTSWDMSEVQIYIGSFYAAQILACYGKKEYMKAKEVCQKAMNDGRNTELCRAFLNEMLAKVCFYIGLSKENNYIEKENWYRLSEKYVQDYLNAKAYYENHPDELYCMQIAPFVGECFDVTKVKEMYSVLICDGLKLRRTLYLNNYITMLCWNEAHVYVFEEIVDVLLEAMNTPFYKLDFSDTDFQAFAKTIRIISQHSALWEYFYNEITVRQHQGVDVQRVIRLIGMVLPDEVEAPKISDEMVQLAVKVKEQIRLLIENGMYDQAKTVIAQVKKIIPADAELDELERINKQSC